MSKFTVVARTLATLAILLTLSFGGGGCARQLQALRGYTSAIKAPVNSQRTTLLPASDKLILEALAFSR